MNSKLIALGLFSISLGLFAVAWTIHDHAKRHGRYSISNQFRLDTATGEVTGCRWVVLHTVDCGDGK